MDECECRYVADPSPFGEGGGTHIATCSACERAEQVWRRWAERRRRRSQPEPEPQTQTADEAAF